MQGNVSYLVPAAHVVPLPNVGLSEPLVIHSTPSLWREQRRTVGACDMSPRCRDAVPDE